MSRLIMLPRLLGFRLAGFQPIFRQDIAMSLGAGPHIILGGNGLGKTTIVQAIVFGLTGGTEEAIEENKSLRWDHRYFRGRLNATQLQAASVEVDFALGNSELTVRRGLKGSQVTGFRTGRSQKWIENSENSHEAQVAFDGALQDLGGYQSTQDFSFIVHRLLYLPESRTLLAWDTNAQVRIFMMLNQDASRESWFNERRDRLKKMDSKKRHIHVALGKARVNLGSLMEFDEQKPEDEESDASFPMVPPPDIAVVVEELRRASKEHLVAEDFAHTVRRNLSEVSAVVEGLHEQIESVEASLISSFLSTEERASSLALYKLLQNGVCPACGTVDVELRAVAEKYARERCCLLCGSQTPQGTDHELATLRSQLSEKLKAQRALEESLLRAEAKLSGFRAREDQLQEQVTSVRLQEPVLALTAPNLPDATKDQLLAQLKTFQSEEADLESQIYKLQTSLRREFQRFRAQVADRTAQLGELYARYATSFLGLQCELTETEESDRLLSLSRFVPKFNGSAREKPETCSEAQRFFLDIAFRMALIDLSSTFSGKPGTFVCETPETALDMSYVDNVVQMFHKFSAEGHTVLLTANIQPNGIAGKILASVRKGERRNHILNLLEIGQLSDVHVAALPKLRAAVRRTLG
jgi:hypothetical protein